MRSRKMYDGDVGYELRGQSSQKFRRKGQVKNQNEIEIEIPNGDLTKGRTFFNHNCAGCHDLDQDLYLGPSLRTVYLRRNGSKKFSNYGKDLTAQKFYWTRKKLWEFLENPEKMFPDTNMQLDGVKDPFLLASVIDYLQYLRVFTCDIRGQKQII
ncbi:unnamed protein product [Paramecium octaurelia]|uniref:Cytochrome c domain-containing protein n=1 Tax=Paramecium octaurelia TaxID=43137 RepID=A0A8S1WHR6_PAROT|nr:unnamed protein product [Paramecium octaurelia]